jgi:hypothetical protein
VLEPHEPVRGCQPVRVAFGPAVVQQQLAGGECLLGMHQYIEIAQGSLGRFVVAGPGEPRSLERDGGYSVRVQKFRHRMQVGALRQREDRGVAERLRPAGADGLRNCVAGGRTAPFPVEDRPAAMLGSPHLERAPLLFANREKLLAGKTAMPHEPGQQDLGRRHGHRRGSVLRDGEGPGHAARGIGGGPGDRG